MKKRVVLVFYLSSFLFFLCCAAYRIPNSLDPESKEFLSKVRYLITKEEREAFLALPASERPGFIEEYWKKRDPNPLTEVNEFKDEYYKRIDQANLLFKEGTTPGWLQDRGRLYVLLGPPDTRETYPRGLTLEGVPTEIWYYGFFPIVFIDENWTGYYRLDPASADQIGQINQTQVMLLPKARPEKGKELLDAHLEVKPAGEGKALLQIKIPYKNIWFNLEGNTFKTTLELSVELDDSSGKRAWEHRQSYSLALAQEEFLKTLPGDYLIEVSVETVPGTYTLSLDLQNTADGSQKKTKDSLTL